MAEEDGAAPRTGRGALLAQLAREDLDAYAVEELDQRIAALTAEIDRAGRARERKRSGRAAADALFGTPSTD